MANFLKTIHEIPGGDAFLWMLVTGIVTAVFRERTDVELDGFRSRSPSWFWRPLAYVLAFLRTVGVNGPRVTRFLTGVFVAKKILAPPVHEADGHEVHPPSP